MGENSDGSTNVKLGDFGVATIVENSEALLFDMCGSPIYLAPEILMKIGSEPLI